MPPNTNTPIKETWLRPVEQLVLPALESRIRILGFTGPETGTGVSTLCRASAEVLARSGARVLLLDLSPDAASGRDPMSWTPGRNGAMSAVAPDPAGFDVLRAGITPDSRFLFNNARSLRSTLSEELSRYSAIVVNLPPLLDARPESINPIACALVCDEVVLVCAQDVTSRTSASQAAEAARAAGVKLTGAVWNRRGASTTGQEMARSARRWLRFAPRLAAAVERRLTRTPLLDG